MNEENTVLEELEDALEETASAEAKERTPMEDFAFWLKDLGNCASYRASIVSLDRSKANVTAADTSEAISSKGKCRDTAQKCVDKAIHEARQKMDVRTSVSGNGSFCQEFRQRFDRRLDALREKLEVLRTPESTAVVDEMESYLTASEIHKKAKKMCGELSKGYQLQGTSAYYDAISYDVLGCHPEERLHRERLPDSWLSGQPAQHRQRRLGYRFRQVQGGAEQQRFPVYR